jgi:hypothetical protein
VVHLPLAAPSIFCQNPWGSVSWGCQNKIPQTKWLKNNPNGWVP